MHRRQREGCLAKVHGSHKLAWGKIVKGVGKQSCRVCEARQNEDRNAWRTDGTQDKGMYLAEEYDRGWQRKGKEGRAVNTRRQHVRHGEVRRRGYEEIKDMEGRDSRL